jgi:hypothetical protein
MHAVPTVDYLLVEMELLTTEKNAMEAPNAIQTASSCVETELLRLEKSAITEPRILMRSPTPAEPAADSLIAVMESEMLMKNVTQEPQTLMLARTAELLVETEDLILESNATTDATMTMDSQMHAEPTALKLIVAMVFLTLESSVMTEFGTPTPQMLAVLIADFQDVETVLLMQASNVIPVRVVLPTVRNSVEMVVLMLVNNVITD